MTRFFVKRAQDIERVVEQERVKRSAGLERQARQKILGPVDAETAKLDRTDGVAFAE